MGRKIVSLLFGGFTRKKKTSSSDSTDDDNLKIENSEFSLPEYESTQPKPPAADPKPHRSRSTSATSKLAHSLSVGVRHFSSRNEEKKLEREDSVWKKTIILGEKCRVQAEDEDDTVLYDENGNRISTYHRKSIDGWTTPSHRLSIGGLRSLSRQNSRHYSTSDVTSIQFQFELRGK